MDQRERIGNFQESLHAALESAQRDLWTALPGIIQSFDPTTQTVSVQPTIKARVRNQKGVITDVTMPLLVKCPLHAPAGGGFSITYPISVGDECLIVFASRCIDAWWQSGGIQKPIEHRMHDLSDGFAIPGIRSVPRVLSGWSTDSLEIRSDDGTMGIELAAGGIININAPGGINITGNLHVSGAVIAGYGGGTQVGLQTHIHGDPQGGTTNPPTPGS